MPKISAVFSDVGGVLLTNGWDHGERLKLVQQFGLDPCDFEDRHHMMSAALDAGQIDINHYLDRTIFYCPRDFTKRDVRDFMYAQSEALPGSLPLIARVAESRSVFLATINNESRELNLHRIEKFGLRKCFSVFFTSCYLGISKPHAEIYQIALDVAQRPPEQCVFIDDRPMNLEAPRNLGLHTIHFIDAEQLENELRSLDVSF